MKNPEYRQALIDNFNEENDIIIPETIWGELVYIFYIVRDIYKSRPDERSEKWIELKRQTYFFVRYMKNK